jgi:hypothetical protein
MFVTWRIWGMLGDNKAKLSTKLTFAVVLHVNAGGRLPTHQTQWTNNTYEDKRTLPPAQKE